MPERRKKHPNDRNEFPIHKFLREINLWGNKSILFPLNCVSKEFSKEMNFMSAKNFGTLREN